PMAALRLFPPSAALIVLVHLVATAYMTGVIWFVQLVHYPLMAGWPHDQFGVWEARHRDLTAFVVIPGMLLEAGTVVLLLVCAPRRVSPWLIGAGALLAFGVWASTFLIQVPCHTLLSLGWDDRVHARLVDTNWLRTVLWTARLGIAIAMVVPLLSDEPS
ncbi:MAG: hypothetical protein ACKOTB_15585, partial [Planctomycetia bacterium]